MNIFLVEDERWALAELVELFRTYEPEHCVYAFDNGEDALDAAGTLRPGLVLTDINMPGIDGLELVERLSQLDIAIKKMIISVHDQFEYARQGMKYGVVEYLVKPVKKEALYKAVNQALEHIEQERRQREELLHGALARMLSTPDISASPKLLQLTETMFGLVLVCLEPGRQIRCWKDAQLGAAELKRHFVSTQVRGDDLYCIDLNATQRVLLMPLANASAAGELADKASRLFGRLELLPAAVHVGFSVKRPQDSLYEAYTLLRQRVEDHKLFGRSTLVSGERKREADLGNIWDRVRVMESHYKKGDMVKGEEVLHSLVERLRCLPMTKRQLGLFVNDMLFSLKFNLLGAKTGSVNIHELQEDPQWLGHVSDYEQLFPLLKEKVMAIYCDAEPVADNPKGLIPVLLGMIHNHYKDNISLQQFAAEHHVSLGYLSRLFKSQTGFTFSEYIVDYRIRKAKELLGGGVDRLQDVSRMVGYEDAKHFSMLFKKLVGETPMAYAKRTAREAQDGQS